MDNRGFDIMPCTQAGADLIAAAKAEFQTALQTSRKESSDLSLFPIKEFGPNCRALFNYGVEVRLR